MSFHPRSKFASEAAAHVLCDDAHLICGQLKVLCEIVARAENCLRGCPDYQVLFVLPFDDMSVCFQADMRLDGGVIGGFHLNGGFLKPCLEFAFLADIRVALIAVPIFSDLRCAFRHRVRLGDNEGQFLQIYLN